MHSSVIFLLLLTSLLLGQIVKAQFFTAEQIQLFGAGAAIFGVISWQFLRQGHPDIDIGQKKQHKQVKTGGVGSGSLSSVSPAFAPSSMAWAPMTNMTASATEAVPSSASGSASSSAPSDRVLSTIESVPSPAPEESSGASSSSSSAHRVLSTMLLSTAGTGLIGTPPSATPLTTFYVATHDENYRIIDYQEVVGWRVGNLKGDLLSNSYSTAVVGDANTDAAAAATKKTIESDASSSSAMNASTSAFSSFLSDLRQSTEAMLSAMVTFLAATWQDLVADHFKDVPVEQWAKWLSSLVRTQLVNTLGFMVRCIIVLTDVMGLFAFLVVTLLGRYSWFFCKEMPSRFRRYAPVLAYLVPNLISSMLARCAVAVHDLATAWGEARERHRLRMLELDLAIRGINHESRMLDERIAREARVAPVDQGIQTDAPVPVPAPALAPASVPAPVRGPTIRQQPMESPFLSRPVVPTNWGHGRMSLPTRRPLPKPVAEYESSDEEELATFREMSAGFSLRAAKPVVEEAPASDAVASDEQTHSTKQEAEPTPTAETAVVEETADAPEAMPQDGAQSIGSRNPMPGAWEAEEEVPKKASSEAGPAELLAEKQETADSVIPAGNEDLRPSTPPPQSQQDKAADEEEKDGGDNGANNDNGRDDKDNDDGDDDDDDTMPGSEGTLSGVAVSPAPVNAKPPSIAALPVPIVNLPDAGQEVPRAARQSPRGILRTENGPRQLSGRVRFAEETNTYLFRGDSCPMEAEDSMEIVATGTPTPMTVPTQPEPEVPQVPQLPEVAEGQGVQAQVNQALIPFQQPLVRPTAIEEAVRTSMRGSRAAGRPRQIRPVRRQIPRREPGQGSRVDTSSVFAYQWPTPAAPQPEPEPVQQPQPSQPPVGPFAGLVNQGSADAGGSSTTTVPEVDMEEGEDATPAVQDSLNLPSTMDVDHPEPPSETNEMEVDAAVPAAETNANIADGEVQFSDAPVQLPPGAHVGEDGVIELGTYTGLGERDPEVIAYRERHDDDSESDSCSDNSESSADSEFEALMGNLDIDEDGHYRSSSTESEPENDDSDSKSGGSGVYSDVDGDAVDESASEESDSVEEDDEEDSDLYDSPPESPTAILSRLSEADMVLARRWWPERMARLARMAADEEEEDSEDEEDKGDGEEDGSEEEDGKGGGGAPSGGHGGNSGGQGGGGQFGDGDAGSKGGRGGNDGDGEAVKEQSSSQESSSQTEPREEEPPAWRLVRNAIDGLPESCRVDPSRARTVEVDGHTGIDAIWVASNPGFLLTQAGKNFLRCNENFRVAFGWRLIRNCEAHKFGEISHRTAKKARTD